MIKHTISWYEASDGTIFTEDWECEDYELNQLYKASGVRLYMGDELLEEFDGGDNSLFQENHVTRMTIDRSKKEENEAFLEVYDRIRGVCWLGDAIEGGIDAFGHIQYPYDPVWGIEYVRAPEEEFMIDGKKCSRKQYDSEFLCTKQENICPVCWGKAVLTPCKHKVDGYNRHSNGWICDVCRKEK